ncbi:MAG: protein TolR [Steroidobacteraceae bacterium]|nr:protein TolR [Steroidobacteraceae bacterium]
MRNKRGRRLMGEINVVPYIDVMLVLLIIFMVTAPMLSQGIKVDLPKASAEPIQKEMLTALILDIDQQGQMYLNIGDPELPLTADRVLEVASAAMRREPERPVVVRADTAVDFGRVVEGMVLLQQSGATKVGFATQPPVAEARPRAQR